MKKDKESAPCKNAADGAAKSRKRSKRKKTVIALVSVFVLLPLLALAAGAIALSVWSDGVELDTSLMPTASAVPVFYDRDGNVIEYVTDAYIPPDSVPKHLSNAFIAVEDKRFYKHKGYDAVRIGGALLSNLKAGRIKEGASTITQQLVKNTHLTHERTVSRKLKEIAIAKKVEKNYSKDEIMSMYLAAIYFGGGAYGVKAASMRYFGKAYTELDLAECATLAGIVKNPSKYSPEKDIVSAKERRNTVLSLMFEQGLISEDEYEQAKAKDIILDRKDTAGDAYAFYVARAIDEITGTLGITKYMLNNSGWKITLNMDSEAQKMLYGSVSDRANYSADDVDGEMIFIDNASGEVLAHASTLPYEAKRQAGSVLKPISVYAPALDSRTVTLATPIRDEPVDFNGYSPKNFGGKYIGDTNPREAIKRSINSVAVKVMDYTGIERAFSYAQAFGIPLDAADKNYALALGATAHGVSPVNIAAAYSAFASGGIMRDASYVSHITDGGRKIDYNARRQERRVIGADTAYIMTSALTDTVKDGTAKSLSTLPFDIASKTGTVEISEGKNSDAWSVSYTRNSTLCVWHGAGSMSELGGGRPTLQAAKLWKRIQKIHPAGAFECPDGVVSADVDIYSSAKLRQVTLADGATPDRYIRSELFPADALPNSCGTLFSKVPECAYELTVTDSAVGISFAPQEIYRYEVYCTDALGERLVHTSDPGCTDKIEIRHSPVAWFGTPVIYSVKTISDNGKGTVISSVSEKKVYVNL